MTTSSSSVPVLGPVLYFTSTDGYSYDVDNRPLGNLDTNIRHINTSLVGIGYGEHASLAGGQLSPGTAVSLAPNGAVFPPTGVPSTNPTENIVGIVIGSTDSGLNRVIWSSKHLDLDVLGLSFISAGQASGSYLVVSSDGTGIITPTSSPNLATQYILGRIKTGPYIEINTASELIANDAAITVSTAVTDNHANMYGFTRLRNLLMYIDIGQTPVQYIKKTIRQSDYYSTSATVNPMSAQLSSDRTVISSAGIDSTVYGNILDNYIIKESYSQFLSTSGAEQVQCGIATSTWSTNAYNTTLFTPNNSENYELHQIPGGMDYNLNVSLFKTFRIDKYYQYYRTTSAPLVGKIMATATVFNPLNTAFQGGENSRLVVWDFFQYSLSTGLESYKYRVILDGASAEQALNDTSIFPTTLIKYTTP